MSEYIEISDRLKINKKKARMGSGAVLFLMFVLFLFPFFTYPDPIPEQEGILVNLGVPDVGQGADNAAAAEAEQAPPEPTPEPEQPKPDPTPRETKPEPQESKKVVTTEDPDAIRLKKQREEAAKKREDAREEQRREDARKQAEAEADRKRQAEADARRKQQEADRQATKDRIGGLFGDGDGKGNTGKEGNQGDTNGDPNADRLEGISTGTGQVGGNLGGRGGKGPTLTDSSQKSGQVTIYVCVDESGSITKANFTQKGSYGSAASDAEMIRKAIDNAKRWNFRSGDREDCGTITYKFKFN